MATWEQTIRSIVVVLPLLGAKCPRLCYCGIMLVVVISLCFITSPGTSLVLLVHASSFATLGKTKGTSVFAID